MIHNDRQYGTPFVEYRDTKTSIEALTGIEEGATAYATDTNQPGWYDGSTWNWLSGTTILHIYNEDLTSQIETELFTTQLVYISGTLQVYYNGLRQRLNYDYIELSGYVTFSTFFPTYSGDVVIVDYDYLESAQPAPQILIVDSASNLLLDSDGNQLIE